MTFCIRWSRFQNYTSVIHSSLYHDYLCEFWVRILPIVDLPFRITCLFFFSSLFVHQRDFLGVEKLSAWIISLFLWWQISSFFTIFFQSGKSVLCVYKSTNGVADLSIFSREFEDACEVLRAFFVLWNCARSPCLSSLSDSSHDGSMYRTLHFIFPRNWEKI